jgi:hypothetical protein
VAQTWSLACRSQTNATGALGRIPPAFDAGRAYCYCYCYCWCLCWWTQYCYCYKCYKNNPPGRTKQPRQLGSYRTQRALS